VSSRQEEKERRRQARLEAEREAERAASRRRLIGILSGGVLAVGAVAAIVIAVAAGGGSSGDKVRTASRNTVPIPKQRATDLKAAAKAAGCTVRSFVVGPNDRGHTNDKVTYKTNPPSYGPHNPVPAQDGIYDPGNTPEKEHLVHALEHGRVEIQYRRGTTARRRSQLETLVDETFLGKPQGYKQLLFENETNMPYAVAATAWAHLIGCPRFNDRAFDALRAFRATYVDKAPEFVPYPE
jgi:hypothetical protein